MLAFETIKIPSASAASGTSPSSPEFYTTQVAPILQTNCSRCHGGVNHRGGFSIDSKESLLKGGKSGPAIIPGHPEQSLLVTLVHPLDPNGTEDRHMPPKSLLTESEIQTLEHWIKAGALIPEQKQAKLTDCANLHNLSRFLSVSTAQPCATLITMMLASQMTACCTACMGGVRVSFGMRRMQS